ncbi:MurR/RpiR family transcriptional regulator [Actinospica robiniae]|uniref:MurR/RpiR family transcriptional regulator n=1 Tax=Actinospica robiniae TaxID=304901 RepID=UPI0004158E9B|nr:MurR/RpiR family transcriptional regulator [Actinospica robiniae]
MDQHKHVDQRKPASEQLLALLDGRRLSPAQRRIAQYLIDNLAEAAFLNSVDLAERAGVSQPAVSRFAAALGFSGYPALRDALRPIVLGAVAETPQQVRRNELQAAIAAEEANLATLHELTADPERFAALGRELAASACLPVLGLRMSDPVAYYFCYGAARIHPDVRFVDSAGSAAFDLLLQARQAGGTWLLAFMLPRYAVETITVLDEAHRQGFKVALVTDSRLAPWADRADVVFPAPVGSRLVFDSHAAPMVLAGLLVQAIADAEPARTQLRLEEHEALHENHAYYLH